MRGIRIGDCAIIEGTFDNAATTGELRVLARAFQVTSDTRYEKAFLTGFDHILEAQYPNGGWPQYYPLREGYTILENYPWNSTRNSRRIFVSSALQKTLLWGRI